MENGGEKGNYYFIGEWQQINILLKKEANYYFIQNGSKSLLVENGPRQ